MFACGAMGDVTAVDRQQLDISQRDAIHRLFSSIRPAMIVNAAAYTAVDDAESNEAAAQAANADAPRYMAEEAKRIGAALVHFSTDYVFDGAKRSPYLESDMPRPQNAYGRTKLAGERAIQESGVPHLIFRTAWVYARQGRNFLLTILRLATQNETLRIVRDQVGCADLELGNCRGHSRHTGSDLRTPGPSSIILNSGWPLPHDS